MGRGQGTPSTVPDPVAVLTYHDGLHATGGESSKSFRPGLLRAIGACLFCWRLRRSPGSDKAPRLVRRWLWGSGLFLVPLLAIALLHLQLGLLQQPGNYSLFGGFVPVEQDGSTELIDTGQLNRSIAAAPAVMAALEPCRVCLYE